MPKGFVKGVNYYSMTRLVRTRLLADALLATLASLGVFACFVKATNIVSKFSRIIE